MKLISSLFIFLISFSVLAQKKVQYDDDFVFKDGIYLSFQDLKNNNPVPITHILSDFDIRAADYLQQVMNTDSIIYYDNLLEERIIPVNRVWGFCSSGKIYVGYNTVEGSKHLDDMDWFPMLFVGAYSYFTAEMAITRFMPPSPSTMMPSGGISMYNDPMYADNGQYYQELVPIQMLLDFSDGAFIRLATGDLNSVSPKLMQDLLVGDRELLLEFEAKNGRDQKQTSMYYIRRFNERNPIYFPVSK